MGQQRSTTDRGGIGRLISQLRTERRWSQAEFAALLADASGNPAITRNEISRWEQGRRRPRRYWLQWIAVVFGMPLADLLDAARLATLDSDTNPDEVEAAELARRVAASDVGESTLDRLESAVDELAIGYPRYPADLLLARTRRHLGYVGRLLDARKTLTQHRRLIVVGGWLSLLAATCSVDLAQRGPATARLRTAAQLADHGEHSELSAWCIETAAWQALTDGDHRRALKLSRAAQAAAPRGTSAFIQATAQEGRAAARLGDVAATLDALRRVEQLVSPMPVPDRPEHHYKYDPSKSDTYVATTLSWVGDAAAEGYARQVIDELESPSNGLPRPRRAALARLDLALALIANNKPDEASHVTLQALTSGRIVPANYWRAREVITAVDASETPEAADLRDAFESLRR